MKAIMYHYVRPDHTDLPYFRHLHLDDFARQLEYFGNQYGFVSQADFIESLESCEPAQGVILTFDDGFKDHYRYVLPELLKRGLWGIFYIPTSPLVTEKLIDVHRIHMLLGAHGAHSIAESLRTIITDDMLSHVHVDEFHTETYLGQNNSENVNYVKRVLNYFIDDRFRQDAIDELMALYVSSERKLAQAFYMTGSEIAHMVESGMIIGSHTVNHPVMSKLSVEKQEKEIVTSFEMLESITGKNNLKTFCYPHGGFHTFTDETENLLETHGCRFSFNVESRDIDRHDLTNRKQALPRFDCNEFPHGSCRQ